MKLEGDVFCEAPDCNHSWHAGLTRFDGRELVSLPPGFLLVKEFSDREHEEFVFCCHDCLMKWAAKVPPPEVIE